MKILVVDDGQLAINSLIRILCRVAPDCDYLSAMTTDDALTWMRQGPMDAAFLNLEMPGMNGLALARMIQKLQPRCNIIVVTEHPEYALEALQIFVSGFLLKPANEADVRNVLENLRYPPETAPVGIKIQCFGNFEISGVSVPALTTIDPFPARMGEQAGQLIADLLRGGAKSGPTLIEIEPQLVARASTGAG